MRALWSLQHKLPEEGFYNIKGRNVIVQTGIFCSGFLFPHSRRHADLHSNFSSVLLNDTVELIMAL